MAIDVALDRINLKPTDISEVILVGGSTRMPCVAASIKKQFGKDPELFGNPDQSVALGAAIYAALKSDSKDLNPLQKKSISKLSLIEAAPSYFGTIVMTEDLMWLLVVFINNEVATLYQIQFFCFNDFHMS